jgi:hypothetical protein
MTRFPTRWRVRNTKPEIWMNQVSVNVSARWLKLKRLRQNVPGLKLNA